MGERSTLLQQISTSVGTRLEGVVGKYSGGNLGTVTYWVMWRFFWTGDRYSVVFLSACVNWCSCASVVKFSNSVVINSLSSFSVSFSVISMLRSARCMSLLRRVQESVLWQEERRERSDQNILMGRQWKDKTGAEDSEGAVEATGRSRRCWWVSAEKKLDAEAQGPGNLHAGGSKVLGAREDPGRWDFQQKSVFAFSRRRRRREAFKKATT